MKSLSKIAAIVTGLSVLTVSAFTLSPVFADSPGQLGGGSEVYQVKNVTQGGSYSNATTAGACDELEYSIELHNAAYGDLSDVQVAVNLPSTSSTTNTSTVTATTNLGGTSGTTGSATVNLSSAQTIGYVNGTAELFDVNGNVIEKLPDTITTTGVDIGSLNASTTEFVNFEAKVSCPTPAQPVYTCNLLNLSVPATKQVQAAVQYTAENGATFQNVTYNFGDNTTPLTTTNTTVQHTYAQYGNYNVTATVSFAVNGSSQTATSTNCAKPVSFVAPTTPTTPTQLVNTGPGDVVGIFAVTTIAGAVAHRWFSRRLARSASK